MPKNIDEGGVWTRRAFMLCAGSLVAGALYKGYKDTTEVSSRKRAWEQGIEDGQKPVTQNKVEPEIKFEEMEIDGTKYSIIGDYGTQHIIIDNERVLARKVSVSAEDCSTIWKERASRLAWGRVSEVIAAQPASLGDCYLFLQYRVR